MKDFGKKCHQFGNDDNNDNVQLYGECAGTEEINIYQKKKIDKVLKECLPPYPMPLIKHKIRVTQDDIPFRLKVRRMSQKL